MDDMKEDREHQCRHHVDIATLSMPTAAAGVGVIPGDGTNFVFEASNNIVEQLADCESKHQQQQNQQSCIEGVVDLEVASELVEGITEKEFVGLLHRTNVKHGDHAGESESSTCEEVIGSEDQPLINDEGTSSLLLSADQFVRTLAKVHNPQHTTKYFDKSEGDVTIVDTICVTDASENSFSKSFMRGTHPVGTGATVSREAFLLSVPANNTGLGKTSAEDKFVLALPEVRGAVNVGAYDNPTVTKSGIAGSLLRNSVTNVAETVAELAREIDHVFDPLPTDVQHVDLRVSIGSEEKVHIDIVVDRKVPIIGYVILVSGLIALSSIGAALDLQRGGVTPEMKIFWRLTSTSILFFFLAANKLNADELGKFTWKQMWIELPVAGCNYAIMNATFAASLEMTSLVNAFVLSNMTSLLMIGGKVCVGQPVLFFEGLGALIGVAGALICALSGDGNDNTMEDHRMLEAITDEGDVSTNQSEMIMVGNLLAFSSSVSTAIYLTVAKRLRPKVDLVLFMFLIFTIASFFMLIYIIAFSGQEFEWSLDPRVGLFGWVNRQSDRLPLELYVAIVCNGVGTMGYVSIMKYFDPVVVAMVMLMEPIVATFIGVAVGVSSLPGWVTWVGDAVVMVGSLMVIWTGSRKTETIDATDALQKEMDDPTPAKSPKLMKSPIVARKRPEAEEEMEFVSVGRKPRMPSIRETAQQCVVRFSAKDHS